MTLHNHAPNITAPPPAMNRWLKLVPPLSFNAHFQDNEYCHGFRNSKWMLNDVAALFDSGKSKKKSRTRLHEITLQPKNTCAEGNQRSKAIT